MLTLIALPVAVVVAGETLARTANVSVKESLPQAIGASDARLTAQGSGKPVVQDPLMRYLSSDGAEAHLSDAQVLARLPRGSRVLSEADAPLVVRYADGAVNAQGREIDLRDPMTTGLFPLVSGRMPAGRDEVVVTQDLVARGFGVGAVLTADGRRPRVVGVVTAPAQEGGRHAAFVVGLPGSLGGEPATTWLADVPGGVSWAQVRDLNSHGLFALSREVVNNPPPKRQVPADARDGGSSGERTLLTLVAALAVVQVVLLAAPAFAVGARRQRRVLAMIGATGGAPRHVRRFVLAQGVVLGGFAGVAGAALGVAAGSALVPAMSLVIDDRGPLEISWRDAALTAAIGAVAAVLAALVPALIAGRQDVLAGLTGRRGTTGRSLRTLLPGLVVLGIGVLGCVRAAGPRAGTFTIVWAALPMVLGAALLAPTVIVLLARGVGRLPFPVRFALRDAARSRGRTAAAAAAVTATVAAAVSLGIGGASDSLQGRETYQPRAPRHMVVVSGLSSFGPTDVAKASRLLSQRLPGAEPVAVSAVVQQTPFFEVQDAATKQGGVVRQYNATLDGAALVGDNALELLGLSPAERTKAAAALRAGKAVIPVDRPSSGDVLLVEYDDAGEPKTPVRAAAYRVVTALHPTQAVLPEALARRIGKVVTTGFVVHRDLTVAEQDRLNEQLTALGFGYAEVERGYTGSKDQRTAMVVLGGTAALLVLGGTLSAALLALSDARPDFSTLMAVGASPRVRRRVAASYAAVIGLLGSLLGTLAGFAPGIAVSYPLTRFNPPGFPDHYLDVPWALIGLLAVGVPLLAAVGAALLTRSRLPLAGRVDT